MGQVIHHETSGRLFFVRVYISHIYFLMTYCSQSSPAELETIFNMQALGRGIHPSTLSEFPARRTQSFATGVPRASLPSWCHSVFSQCSTRGRLFSDPRGVSCPESMNHCGEAKEK